MTRWYSGEVCGEAWSQQAKKHSVLPKGRLGKRAVQLRAIAFRKHLSETSGVKYLGSRQLQQAVAVQKLCESEWLKETRKKALGLGYKGSEARKKVERARKAEEKVIVTKAAVETFRYHQFFT
ncbi:unnamed protein product [Choristocarpus tenellus]